MVLSAPGRCLPRRRSWDILTGFARSRGAGAMLAGGAFAITVMATAGSLMANYAWHEAQRAELDAATRAAVSAAGPRLATAGSEGGNEAIRDRIADYLGALMPGRDVAADDVSISRDDESEIITITVGGTYAFTDLWGSWGRGDRDAESVVSIVRVKFEAERYEVAVALDVSPSMDRRLPSGVRKLDALKAAVGTVADVMGAAAETNPRSLMVSVVPFASAVNVADTGGAGESPSKKRYVRMLAGARADFRDTLADARSAKRDGVGGHWVDAFHHYGAGTGLGPLRRRFLPDDLLDGRDWNLRRTAVEIDVSAQNAAMGTWTVDDADFWNGCVIARWGAYWNPHARPGGWTPDEPANWPAKSAVDAWSPGARPLPPETPLHLSDAPPRAAAPSTLFTAYSWPDARVGGLADHRLQASMMELLEPDAQLGSSGPRITSIQTGFDNDWAASDSGGATLCPTVPIAPLTDDLARLNAVATGLQTTKPHAANREVAATYLNLGIVWGLRTLSPLWDTVWDVDDVAGASRPAVPCSPGETAGCSADLFKSILIVTDGGTYPGPLIRNRLMAGGIPGRLNRGWADTSACRSFAAGGAPRYYTAATERDPDAFNAHFRTPRGGTTLVDNEARFNALGVDAFVDAWLRMQDPGPDTPARRQALADTLATAVPPGVAPTPWQTFSGLDGPVADFLAEHAALFGLDGRPVHIGHFCRPSSIYGPYGRIDDHVYAGDIGPDITTPPAPVADVAPFELASLPAATVGDGSPGAGDYSNGGGMEDEIETRLEDWFIDACAVAGVRRVRINAIYIGRETSHWNRENIALMERCVDAAGGDPDADDVFVTPDAAEIADAFEQIFTIRRNLRFLD